MNIKDDDQEQQQDEERDPLLQEMIDYLKQNKTSFVQALLKEQDSE